jgi:hypothetical protein
MNKTTIHKVVFHIGVNKLKAISAIISYILVGQWPKWDHLQGSKEYKLLENLFKALKGMTFL